MRIGSQGLLICGRALVSVLLGAAQTMRRNHVAADVAEVEIVGEREGMPYPGIPSLRKIPVKIHGR